MRRTASESENGEKFYGFFAIRITRSCYIAVHNTKCQTTRPIPRAVFTRSIKTGQSLRSN